ncbi:MAG: phage tail protein, partial [Gemmatimonadaceae bacterium]|nr:phage tail protein [Gemmatimonadaceae bacterium]
MSGLLGPKTQSTSEPKLNSIQVNQSSYGAAIPLVYGQCRLPITLLWYDGFTAIPHTERQRGGKGGGGGVRSTTYTYQASLILGLCEGPLGVIGNVWKDKDLTSIAGLGFTTFVGDSPQTIWTHLSTNYPGAAIPYDRTVFVAHAAFDLGSSAALPNLTFEVTALMPYQPGTINDAEPAAILADYLTNVHHGAGFAYLADLTGAGATTYETYCRAMGYFLSPEEKTQRPAHEFVAEILKITNSEAVWSAGQLRVVPRGDEAVTGNGRTYTPDLTPLWNFTDADFIASGDDDPVTVERKAAAELFNIVRVEFLNRARQYNPEPVEARDELDIALNGERVAPTVRYHAIKDAAVARQVAQVLLQQGLYVRNRYRFRLPFDFSLIEPMDLASLTDARIGLANKLVRVLEVSDDESDELEVLAEEVPVGPAAAPRYNWQLAQGYAANYAAAPGSVLAPYIFTAPPLLVSAEEGYEIWIAVSGPNNGAWGGCDVYFSLDNLEYVFAGAINGPARHGTLGALINAGADPDTSSTLRCVLSNSTLELGSGTTADADNNRLLLMVDGEVMSYRDAVLISAGTYDVSYLRRGKFGSSRTAHASGAKWARLDSAIFRMRYDPGLAGRTVYFKFPSRNVYGGGQQSLADCTAYTLTVSREVSSGLFFKSTDTLAWDC